MAFLSVLLGVGVDYFIDYLFLPAPVSYTHLTLPTKLEV